MRYDKPLIAGLIGAGATVPGEIFSRVLLSFGIGKYSIYELGSLLITFNRPTPFMGLLLNIIIGGVVGIIFYYALAKIGQDYMVFKSVGLGLVFWLLAELLLSATVEGKYIDIRPIVDYYTHCLGAMVYGVAQGLLFKRYLFNQSVQE